MSPMYDLSHPLRCDVERFRKFRIGLALSVALANLLVAFGSCCAKRHGRIQIPKNDALSLLLGCLLNNECTQNKL